MIGAFLAAAGLVALAVLAWCLARMSPRQLVRAVGRRAPKHDVYARRIEEMGLKTDVDLLLGARLAGTGAGGVLALASLAVGSRLWLLFLVLAIVSWIWPDRWLASKEKQRIEDLEREFPLMVTLVRVYARASDLYQALVIVRGALRGEMRRQVDILARELQVCSLQEALENFAARSRYPLLSHFVTVVRFGITTGTNVDEILDGFSRRAYESRVNTIKRKIKAQPVIMSILPAVLAMSLLLLFVFPMYSNIIDRLRAF